MTLGGDLDIFLLPIRTCDLCFCVGHCVYSGHERPSLNAGKISLHPSYQKATSFTFMEVTVSTQNRYYADSMLGY